MKRVAASSLARRLAGARRALVMGAGLALVPVAASGCKRNPMARIEAVRDALASRDARALTSATSDLPMCKEPFADSPERGCLTDLAKALGARELAVTSPDQASATAVAIVLVRERRGDWAPNADAWLSAISSGKGAGGDALRLAVARRMAEASPLMGAKIDDAKAARALLAALGSALPGACPTYALYGAGVDPETLKPALTAEHSPCVQRDLERRDGPGGAYGDDVWRAAGGAVALWKDEARALTSGAAAMVGKPKDALAADLATIDLATTKLALRSVTTTQNGSGDAAAHADAGVNLAPRP